MEPLRFRKLLRDAWRNVLVHRLRSFLSTLGVVFAVSSVLTMLAVIDGAKSESIEQVQQLGTNNIIVREMALTQGQRLDARRWSSRGLDHVDETSIEAGIPGLDCVAPLREIHAELSSEVRSDAIQILAVTDQYAEAKGLSVQSGRFICQRDVTYRDLVCVLGQEVLELLGSEGKLGGIVKLGDQPYQVVGILARRAWSTRRAGVASGHNPNLAVFIPMAAEPPGSEKPELNGEYSELSVRMRDADQVARAAEAIRRILHNNHSGVQDYQVLIPQELLDQLEQSRRVFNIVLASVACVSLLVGGIGIMNIMLVSVSERRKEIGIRRAVGANQQHILLLFLTETLLLANTGAVVGMLLGIALSSAVSIIAGWRVAITIWSLLLSLVMSTAVAVISGLYPALKAARLDPSAALRTG